MFGRCGPIGLCDELDFESICEARCYVGTRQARHTIDKRTERDRIDAAADDTGTTTTMPIGRQ